MLDTTKKTIATLTAAAFLGGGSWAIAQTTGGASTQKDSTPNGGQVSPGGPGGMGMREQVTGATAERVKDAVLAKEPGATVLRVMEIPQGYVAAITKSDGSRAMVRLDEDMKVVSVDAHGGMRRAELTGDALTKVKAAVTAKLPGSTLDHAHKSPRGSGYDAHVVKADGTRVHVELDAQFKVTSVSAALRGPGRHGGPGGMRRAELTGDALTKVKAAVTAKLPGSTLDHAHKSPRGSGYDAHVVKADGTRVHVELDAQFKVTSVSAALRGPGRHGGPGGPMGGETPLTGDDAAKAKAAALAKLPGATVDRVETDAHGAKYEAHVTKADGTPATVKMDEDFTVTSVEEG